MSSNAEEDSALLPGTLSLLRGTLEALIAAAMSAPDPTDNSRRLFFPAGIGKITLSVTALDASVSLTVSSQPESLEEIGFFGPRPPPPPPPAETAHPMDATPRWNPVSGETYELSLTAVNGETKKTVGHPVVIELNADNSVDFGKF